MESLDAPDNFMDGLLDFSSDVGEEEDDTTKTLSLPFPLLLPTHGVKTSGIVEEELEWISNKDAFPMVESLVDIIIPNHNNSHRSPVSVLEIATSSNSAVLSLTSSFKIPVRARSKKRKRRREFLDGQQWLCYGKENQKTGKQRSGVSSKASSSTLGRKCLHCQSEKTPQWRAGPIGPKTLCNACGVRYKSGRLVPEYRPASSPTFSTELHSNSHRKIVEMRKQKQVS